MPRAVKSAYDDDPKFGAGSVFGKDMKEESRLKKLGSVRKKYDPT